MQDASDHRFQSREKQIARGSASQVFLEEDECAGPRQLGRPLVVAGFRRVVVEGVFGALVHVQSISLIGFPQLR